MNILDICDCCGSEYVKKFPCSFIGCREVSEYDLKIEMWHVEYLLHKKLCKKHAGIMSSLIRSVIV